MKLKKLIFPALAFLLLSSTTFAQQTKISEVDQIGVAKKDRKDKKEAAISKPTNSDDQLMEKKVYKKKRQKGNERGAESMNMKYTKMGATRKNLMTKARRKSKGKGLKLRAKHKNKPLKINLKTSKK